MRRSDSQTCCSRAWLRLPPGLSIDNTTGLISGTISAGAAQDTPYNTEVDISNAGNSVTRVIPWTVRHVLVANPGDRTTLGGSAVSLQVLARDSLNASLQYSATGLPAGLSIVAGTGLISGTVSAGAIQGIPYAVTVSATNGMQSDSQAFAWTVGHSSDIAPTLTNPGNRTSHVDEMVSVQLQATDPEQDILTYSAMGLPDGIGIDPQTGLISGQLYDAAYHSTPFAVTVTADDGHGGITNQSFQWSFALPNLSGTSAAVSAVEGAAFTNALVASFTDLQTGAPADYWPYSATIDWGDGTTTDDGVIDGANNSFQVSGDHTYARAGTFTVQTIITQGGGLGSVTVNSTATVSNPALTATALSPSYTLDDNWSAPVAVFDDPNPFEAASGYSATVTWADNVTSTATVTGAGGKFAVYTNRTFPAAGSKSFTVTISDNEGATATVGGSATVGQLAAGDLATLNVSLYGTQAGTTPSGYSETINWGDGSPTEAGVINPNGNTFTVGGQHRYTVPGSYAVTVVATSPLGGTLTATQTVTAARKPIRIYGQTIDTTVGETLTNTQVAVIVDPNNALPAAPNIGWGDGTSSPSRIVGGNGLYRLLGDTTNPASGNFLVSAEGDTFWKGFWGDVGLGLFGVSGVLYRVVSAKPPAATPVTPKSDIEDVTKGKLVWELTAPDPKGYGCSMKIAFIPSKDNPATAIAFIQVVREATLDGKPSLENMPKGEKEFRLKSNVDKATWDHLDALQDWTAPYYFVRWDPTAKKWVGQGALSSVGNGPRKMNMAKMLDEPSDNPSGRRGKVVVARFETAVFSIDSQEVLGVIQWGFSLPADRNGKVVLLGATKADVSLAASAEFKKVVQKANTMPEFEHAQLDGKATITKPNGKKFAGAGASALPD